MSEINFSVKSDVMDKIGPALEAIGPAQFQRALGAAAKRATTAGSTVARKEIASRFTVQKSFIGKNAVKARATKGSFEIYSRGERLNSTSFLTNPKRGSDTTGRNRAPIFIQIYKSSSPGYIKNSWLWNANGGLHLARFSRGKKGPRGGKTFAIKGPAVPQMLSNESVRESVVDTVIDTFEKRLRHEVEYRLSKHMGGK